jgi:hypothetical protein
MLHIAAFAQPKKALHIPSIRLQVVRIYEGKGKVAALAYTEPQWIEGRLWEYSDGSCGFVWLDRLFDFVLVQFERIDADLRPSC